ncbi:hypothetical protein [Hymenobacter algoricola]|uniref:UPF0323 domain-containing protein n=1 Tax=Hymenobacter algoricola TaxID=486267 RepID=A0ABP7N490_9BACT
MNKSFYRLGDWRRNLLLVTAAASLAGLPACSSDNRTAEETVTDDWGGDTYSEGVITEMTEVKPGQWKVTAERPAGKEEVAAILHHFDGKTDTLQGQALQKQMQDYSRQVPENRVAGTGMMDILMWSGIGYMAGRFLTPNPGAYANSGLMQRNQGWRQNISREREQQGRGFYGRGFSGSRSSRSAGIQESPSFSRSAYGGTYRSAAPSGRSSGFGGRSGGFGG